MCPCDEGNSALSSFLHVQVLRGLQGTVIPQLMGVGELTTLGFAFLALGLVNGVTLAALPSVNPEVAAAAEAALAQVGSLRGGEAALAKVGSLRDEEGGQQDRAETPIC